jgi:hypothetical protein
MYSKRSIKNAANVCRPINYVNGGTAYQVVNLGRMGLKENKSSVWGVLSLRKLSMHKQGS